jgi:Undecaprenyl-phosphate galactose phosphotransferase WbaP
LWGRPIAILGTGPIAARVTRYLLDHPGVGLHPVVAFGDADWDVPTLPVTGRLETAWQALPRLNVQHAIVTPESAARVGYDEVLRHAERSLRFVQFIPDLHGVPASSVVAAPLGTTLGLEVRNQLASRTNRAVKRLFDLVGSLALLVVLSPLLLLVALWIRLDTRGPALYLSPRVGRYGRTFACVKFRTMHVDAEVRLARMLTLDPTLQAEYERFHKLHDDPRVTRAGRFLRAFSLDELAQLFNVVVGDMSLVGPRPYLVRELGEMGSERELIFLARPGMTGYWQVEGRNDVTFDERQTLEAAYVRNWSVWWDVELMLRTPVAVWSRRGK